MDSLQDAPDRFTAVGEPGEDGQNVVFQVGTGEEFCGGDIADVEDSAGVRQAGAFQNGGHSEGSLTYVDDQLLWYRAISPVDCERVFGHAEGHSRVVAALEFNVDEMALGGAPEQVHMPGADFREFGGEPFGYVQTREASQKACLELTLQKALEGNVELIHEATGILVTVKSLFSEGDCS